MKHEWQDVFQRTAKFADIKTYIFYHLFDTYIIDYSMASATGMFNLETLDWDVGALGIAWYFQGNVAGISANNVRNERHERMLCNINGA